MASYQTAFNNNQSWIISLRMFLVGDILNEFLFSREILNLIRPCYDKDKIRLKWNPSQIFTVSSYYEFINFGGGLDKNLSQI